MYYADFPWNDYCFCVRDPSLCAERITEEYKVQAKSVFQLAKHSFIDRKCENLSNSNFPCDFWHLAKNIPNNFISSSFPPFLHPDGTTAITSVSKAQTFAYTSTLDDSELILPSPPPSDLFQAFSYDSSQ
ncbi:hypothetical protein E2C01_052932 [Portunus trituberculatus]|uniref:Uncharacterized protein n=1 Tax=Portunus trituberculatus TaxID=210409 RepID=A0A5B7GF35_PORTR|nr:hypothetical protein [Portunus trituberculatus]